MRQLIIVGLLLSFLCWGCQGQSSEKAARKARFVYGQRLDSLLRKGDLGQALLMIDTLHTLYPNDPQFYFGEGWIYYMRGDSLKSASCFLRARSLYDSLVVANDDLSDKINHAFLTQVLFGMEKYDEEIAAIAKDADSKADSINVAAYQGMKLDLKELYK